MNNKIVPIYDMCGNFDPCSTQGFFSINEISNNIRTRNLNIEFFEFY